jgi:short-subunit dehydrogenase
MDWRWCLDVNLWGVIHGCHYFVPKFKAQGCGGIINVASVAGYAAVPSFTAYNVSKTAVVALSETLAAELAGQGVQVTVLCPTAVKTNIIENGNLPQGTGSFASSIMSKWVFSETADAVAKQTLDALDRKKLYVMPQMDSRLVWRLKRFAPRLYEKALGEVYRLSTD